MKLTFTLSHVFLLAGVSQALDSGTVRIWSENGLQGDHIDASIYYRSQGWLVKLTRDVLQYKSLEFMVPANTTITILGANDCTSDYGNHNTDSSYSKLYKINYSLQYENGDNEDRYVSVSDIYDNYWHGEEYSHCDGSNQNDDKQYFFGINYFAWNVYDPVLGYFTVYLDEYYGGAWKKFFLTDFEENVVHKFEGHNNDDISSIDWPSLGRNIRVEFYKSDDGSDTPYYIETYGNDTATGAATLESGFNDKISSFKWFFNDPLKTEDLNNTGIVSEGSISPLWTAWTTVEYFNHFEVEQTSTVTLGLTRSYTNSTQVSRTYSEDYSIGGEVSYSPSETTGGIEFQFQSSYDGSDSTEKAHTTTSTMELSGETSVDFNIPANSHYVATLSFDFYTVSQDITTERQLWYSDYVDGAVQDESYTYNGFSTWTVKEKLTSSSSGSSYYVENLNTTYLGSCSSGPDGTCDG